ncbi:MAG: hypothetical protein HW380_2503 [Magnetococcales bacterium]|nr:hypothetical protein [Magnetococcales bacterium]
MHKPDALRIYQFGVNDPLSAHADSRQKKYLLCYLRDLNAASVLEEPNYFDWDYLAQFSGFYSVSSRGYVNICRRLHFFSGKPLTRDRLKRAASGSQRIRRELQNDYLGFVVIRPLDGALLGRTVVRWYPETLPYTPRVFEPAARAYRVHVAGIPLTVTGLAWQQQDTGVAACATVSLWTLFQSSAFDEFHAIPTTAKITQDAHKSASLGERTFPSKGLNVYQMLEAIKEQNLSPLVVMGEVQASNGSVSGFSKAKFASTCASLIRSGFPVIVMARIEGQPIRHAVCLVGFRENHGNQVAQNDVILHDGGIDYVYVNDDNLGPNVRFKLNEKTVSSGNVAVLRPEAPTQSSCKDQDPISNYCDLIPYQIVVATPHELRLSTETLHEEGKQKARAIQNALQFLLKAQNQNISIHLTLSIRFLKIAEYTGNELGQTLGSSPHLGRVRLSLSEKVPPMSLYVGVVRIGFDVTTPLLDVLYDTTDTDRNHPVFAHMVYHEHMPIPIQIAKSKGAGDFGVAIPAY